MWSSWGARSVHCSCWAGVKIICHPDNLQDPQNRVLTTSKAVKLNLRLVGSTGQCAAALALPIPSSRDLSVRFIVVRSSLQDQLSTWKWINFSLSYPFHSWLKCVNLTGVAWKQAKTQSSSHQECVHPVRGLNDNYKKILKDMRPSKWFEHQLKKILSYLNLRAQVTWPAPEPYTTQQEVAPLIFNIVVDCSST